MFKYVIIKSIKVYTKRGNTLKIHGFNKTTLLDYPGRLAATIFLGDCNFRCPFCHNMNLVLNSKEEPYIEDKEVLEYLDKRKNILEGVCISGGEPTLHLELTDFIREIKKLGLNVKLDSNGYRPEIIMNLKEEGLIDYIAMDIKAPKDKYCQVAGVKSLDMDRIQKSIDYIMNNFDEYEFRTTVVKELHTRDDILNIAEWLKGCKKYKLQNYRESEGVMVAGFSSYTDKELDTLQREVDLIWS